MQTSENCEEFRLFSSTSKVHYFLYCLTESFCFLITYRISKVS